MSIAITFSDRRVAGEAFTVDAKIARFTWPLSYKPTADEILRIKEVVQSMRFTGVNKQAYKLEDEDFYSGMSYWVPWDWSGLEPQYNEWGEVSP